MTDENHTFPTDVKFTGEAPSHNTPPEIPDPNLLFFREAMNTFHKYVLHMFEQFQDDIAGLQRRVQMMEFVVNAQNHIGVEVATELKRIDEMTAEMDETLVHIQERMVYSPVPGGVPVDFSKAIYPRTQEGDPHA